jgi:hypothetical protein
MQQLFSKAHTMLNTHTENKHTVTTVKNTAVKHSPYISVLQAHEQHEMYKHLYTQQQHAHAQQLAQALQQQYANKHIYITARKTFIAVKLEGVKQVTNNLLLVAKQYNAKVVLTQNNLVLRLFTA